MNIKLLPKCLAFFLLIACEGEQQNMSLENEYRIMNQMHTKLTVLKQSQCGPFTLRISKGDSYSIDSLKQDSDSTYAKGGPESAYQGIVFDIIKPSDFNEILEFTFLSSGNPELFSNIFKIERDGKYSDLTTPVVWEDIGLNSATEPYSWQPIGIESPDNMMRVFVDNQYTISTAYSSFIDATPIAVHQNKSVFIGDKMAIKFNAPFMLRWNGGSCKVNIPEVQFTITS